jgi:hypothetical protein
MVLAIAGVLALALGLRLLVALAHLDAPLSFDPADYDRHARSLVDHLNYPSAYAAGPGPTAFRPPGYPMFLAGVYAVTGGGPGAGRVAQALLGTVIVALIGLIALQLWGMRAKVVASGIAAVYPPLVLVGATLLSEPLFVVLLLGATAAALAHRRAGRGVRWALAAGVLAGLAWLTRSLALLAFLPLAWLLWDGRPRWSRAALAAPATFLAAAALVVAPWTARNLAVLDAFIPVSDQAGYTLAGTYNETARRDPVDPGLWRPAQADPHNARLMTAGRPTEVEYNARLLAAAREHALEHPGYVLEVAARNTVRMLQLDDRQILRRQLVEESGVGAFWRAAGAWAFYLLALLALLGAGTRLARSAPRALWAIPAAMLLVVFIEPGLRMRAPIDAFLVLLAAAAATAATRFSRRWA